MNEVRRKEMSFGPGESKTFTMYEVLNAQGIQSTAVSGIFARVRLLSGKSGSAKVSMYQHGKLVHAGRTVLKYGPGSTLPHQIASVTTDNPLTVLDFSTRVNQDGTIGDERHVGGTMVIAVRKGGGIFTAGIGAVVISKTGDVAVEFLGVGGTVIQWFDSPLV